MLHHGINLDGLGAAADVWPWQRKIGRLWLNGTRRYVLSLPTGNGQRTAAALYAAELLTTPRPDRRHIAVIGTTAADAREFLDRVQPSRGHNPRASATRTRPT